MLAELALAVVVWLAGLGWTLHGGGALDLLVTCLWVVAVVNAFNLFDNMDGAAATMALVVAGGAALIGVVRGDVWLAVAARARCAARALASCRATCRSRRGSSSATAAACRSALPWRCW